MSEGLKVIKIDLPEFDDIEVYPISDLHWSDEWTMEKEFLKFIEFILDKDNRFVVLNGDLLNMALTVSVSDTYSEKYHPSEAVTGLSFHIRKLVEKNRVLGMGTGNHEDRVYKYTGIDVSKYLAMESGLPLERYSDNSFVIFVKVNKNTYSLFFHHGVGGGRMKGGKVNMVVRMNQIVNADVFVVGHVHDPMMTSSLIYECDYKNMKIKEKSQYYVIANAWQKYGGYGQKFGFAPASTEITYLSLSGKGNKRVKVKMGI